MPLMCRRIGSKSVARNKSHASIRRRLSNLFRRGNRERNPWELNVIDHMQNSSGNAFGELF